MYTPEARSVRLLTLALFIVWPAVVLQFDLHNFIFLSPLDRLFLQETLQR